MISHGASPARQPYWTQLFVFLNEKSKLVDMVIINYKHIYFP